MKPIPGSPAYDRVLNETLFGRDLTGRDEVDLAFLERYWIRKFTRVSYEKIIMDAEMVQMMMAFLEPAMELLSDRAENEAYAAAKAGGQYLVYFTDGGAVTLDLSGAAGELQLRWLEIGAGDWAGAAPTVSGGEPLAVEAPGRGGWMAVITR